MLHAPFSVLHTHYLFLNMFKIILWHRYNDNPFFIEYTKVKKLSQGQTWKNQDSNPGSQGPKPSLFTITRMSRGAWVAQSVKRPTSLRSRSHGL